MPRLADISRHLLSEQVSIGNMRAVLEAIAEIGQRDQAPGRVADQVRMALRRQICLQWAGASNSLNLLVLEGAVEEAVRAKLKADPADTGAMLDPALVRAIQAELRRHDGSEAHEAGVGQLIVLASPDIRRAVRTGLARHGSDTPVLCHAELAPEFSTRIAGTVSAAAVEGRTHAQAPRHLQPVQQKAA